MISVSSPLDQISFDLWWMLDTGNMGRHDGVVKVVDCRHSLSPFVFVWGRWANLFDQLMGEREGLTFTFFDLLMRMACVDVFLCWYYGLDDVQNRAALWQHAGELKLPTWSRNVANLD